MAIRLLNQLNWKFSQCNAEDPGFFGLICGSPHKVSLATLHGGACDHILVVKWLYTIYFYGINPVLPHHREEIQAC